MINSPCKDCTDRVVACWDKCEKYKDFKFKLEEQRKASKIDKDYYNYASDRNDRINKILKK